MLRSIAFTTRRETLDEMRSSGHYNPARVATFRDGNRRRSITLSAGDGDTVDIYRAHGVIYVVTIRRSLGYVGCDCYVNGEPAGEVFVDRDYDIAATFGRSEDDYSALDRLDDRDIARRIVSYLNERCY